jgi:hypothetical protein
MRGFLALLATVVALSSVGCGSTAPKPLGSGGESATDSGLGGDDTVTCATDPRVDIYTAHLQKAGEKGVVTFELVSSDPAPPHKDGNVFVVAAADADGNALNGTLTADPYMPVHMHHAVTPSVSFDPATNTYSVNPVYLFMPGLWRVELDYFGDGDANGEPVDRAYYYFCIEG